MFNLAALPYLGCEAADKMLGVVVGYFKMHFYLWLRQRIHTTWIVVDVYQQIMGDNNTQVWVITINGVMIYHKWDGKKWHFCFIQESDFEHATS